MSAPMTWREVSDETMRESDLQIMAHLTTGAPTWYDVGGDLDSCGHRHPTRADAAICKKTMIAGGQ